MWTLAALISAASFIAACRPPSDPTPVATGSPEEPTPYPTAVLPASCEASSFDIDNLVRPGQAISVPECNISIAVDNLEQSPAVGDTVPVAVVNPDYLRAYCALRGSPAEHITIVPVPANQMVDTVLVSRTEDGELILRYAVNEVIDVPTMLQAEQEGTPLGDYDIQQLIDFLFALEIAIQTPDFNQVNTPVDPAIEEEAIRRINLALLVYSLLSRGVGESEALEPFTYEEYLQLNQQMCSAGFDCNPLPYEDFAGAVEKLSCLEIPVWYAKSMYLGDE